MARVRRPSNLSTASRFPTAFIFISVTAVAVAGYFIYKHLDSGGDDAAAETTDEAATPSTDRSSAAYAPAIGPENAPVVLAKWADFQ